MLDDMHKRKNDMANKSFTVNVSGYIGLSTRNEIEYVKKNGKKIRYLEPVKKDISNKYKYLNKYANTYYL